MKQQDDQGSIMETLLMGVMDLSAKIIEAERDRAKRNALAEKIAADTGWSALDVVPLLTMGGDEETARLFIGFGLEPGVTAYLCTAYKGYRKFRSFGEAQAALNKIRESIENAAKQGARRETINANPFAFGAAFPGGGNPQV